MPDLRNIPLDQIMEPPAPMRVTIDEQGIYDLRDSIRALGLLQPIIVVPVKSTVDVDGKPSDGEPSVNFTVTDTRYEIVAGHRRFLASRLVPLAQMPCMVYEDGSLAKEAAMLAENVYREDITAAEEGYFYCELVEKHTLTEAQLCAMVKQSPDYIYARMDLVRGDEVVSRLNAARKINFTVAKELMKCKDVAHRHYLATMAAESGATGNVVKSWVAQYVAQQQGALEPPPAQPTVDAGTPVHENTIKCWMCNGEKDPQNLRLIYVHWYELEGLRKILVEAGLAPGAPSAAAAGD
jgi:ParB family chromosome partitioning protein